MGCGASSGASVKLSSLQSTGKHSQNSDSSQCIGRSAHLKEEQKHVRFSCAVVNEAKDTRLAMGSGASKSPSKKAASDQGNGTAVQPGKENADVVKEGTVQKSDGQQHQDGNNHITRVCVSGRDTLKDNDISTESGDATDDGQSEVDIMENDAMKKMEEDRLRKELEKLTTVVTSDDVRGVSVPAISDKLQTFMEHFELEIYLENWYVPNRQDVDEQEKLLRSRRNKRTKLLMKLSEQAGARMKHNNPGIADLSDKNRATKLAEQLSELYDNEWTDVYEAARENANEETFDSKRIVEFLRDSLKFCYDRCVEMADHRRGLLMKTVTFASEKDATDLYNEPGVALPVKDYMKRTLSFTLRHVIQFISETMNKDEGLKKASMFARVKKAKVFSVYTVKCIEICWKTQLQDPPVVLEFKNTEDTSMFRQYTQTGSEIEFVVWPVLLLHNAGPVLGKGVAQYKKTEKEREIEMKKLKDANKSSDAVELDNGKKTPATRIEKADTSKNDEQFPQEEERKTESPRD